MGAVPISGRAQNSDISKSRRDFLSIYCCYFEIISKATLDCHSEQSTTRQKTHSRLPISVILYTLRWCATRHLAQASLIRTLLCLIGRLLDSLLVPESKQETYCTGSGLTLFVHPDTDRGKTRCLTTMRLLSHRTRSLARLFFLVSHCSMGSVLCALGTLH